MQIHDLMLRAVGVTVVQAHVLNIEVCIPVNTSGEIWIGGNRVKIDGERYTAYANAVTV